MGDQDAQPILQPVLQPVDSDSEILDDAAESLAFMLSVIRCGEELRAEEEERIHRIIVGLRQQYQRLVALLRAPQFGDLEIDTNGRGEVVMNLPRDMTGHLVFSPEQARQL